MAVPEYTPAQLEYVRATGSNMPTLAVSAGQKITFPEGVNVEPWKKLLEPATPITKTLEKPPAPMGLETTVGLYMTTLVEVEGAKMTFPLGAKVADSHVPNPPAGKIGPTFEKPEVASEYELYIPMFPAADVGVMTTFPFGKSTPDPKSDVPPAYIGPTLVIASVVGLKTPMLAESLGTMMTLPVGPSTPPWNRKEPPAALAPTTIFEYVYETGLNRPILETFHGMNTTLPLGTRTPPLNLPVVAGIPVAATVEKRPVAGLYIPTFDELAGTKRTRPSGSRTEPP